MAALIRDRYEPLAVVGRGGEAQVVKGFDHQLERVVAMKIRPVPEGARRDELLREARILVDVPPNPHLPLVREDFFDDGRYVVVMDWVEGTDLSVLLKSEGRPGLAPSNVLRWMADAASALTHLHTQPTPVVHGDVKPANLILSSGGRIMLVDFGLSSSPNVPGTPGGTVGYVAPEVAAGGPPSRASDIYALAATGWALLTGAPPSGALPAWSGIDPDVAEDMEAALRAGLATHPARRPGTPGELVERLRAGWGSTLPTGVITFCLSDIEASTALWEHHPGAMGRALLRHDELIATAVESHGGRFLKSMGEGDSTFSVFDSATQAIDATVAALRVLEAEQWRDDLTIRVRFGLHTGEAERRGTDYFGPAVALAARLRAQADGGHVFVSATTARLVERSLPRDFELVDLGAHRLRGFDSPENIFALHGPGVDAPRPMSECPYRGLLPFEAEDHELFFGREDVVQTALSRLAPGRLLAVVGPSGSGKSSVLRAGLAAGARAGRLSGITGATVITPGARPPVGEHVAEDTLVIVDQFEELYTLCTDPVRRSDFIHWLLQLDGAVAIGVRADFYGELAGHHELAERVASDQILLGPMTSDEVASAITEPARVAGIKLEPGLVELVMRDVAGEPGALPLLSHALRATWEHRDGRTLTLDGYRRTGGVSSALAQTADELIDALPASDRAIVRQVLIRLTELGDGTEDTRRRVAIGELVTGESAETVRALLQRLADARLVTLGEGTAEIAHEVLIRQWPTLRGWLDEDREGLRRHRRLSDAARLWDDGRREESDLYRGIRLAAAEEWAHDHGEEMNATERAFLDAGVARADAERRSQLRSNRRLRRSLAGVGTLLVVAVAAGAVAVDQRGAANERAREATVQRIAAQSLAIGPDDMATGALLAVEAARRETSPQTRGALIGSLAVAPRLLRYFTEPARSEGSVALTADGRMLGVSHAGRVEFYDTESLEPMHDPIVTGGGGEGGAVDTDFDVSADGRYAAVSGPDQAIERWDVAANRRLGRFELPAPWTERNDIGISPDGRWVVAAVSNGGEQPAVLRFDENMELAAEPASLGEFGFPEAKFCGDGSVVVAAPVGSGVGQLFRLHADTLEPIGAPTGVPGDTGSGRLSCARGSNLAVLPTSEVAAVIDAVTGDVVQTAPVGYAVAAAVLDDRTVLVLLDGGAMITYDTVSGETIGETIETTLLRVSVAVTPDGSRAYVGGSRVAEISLDGATPLGTLVAGTAGATRVSQDLDGSTVAVVVGSAEEPSTRFVDRDTGSVTATLSGWAQYLPDGRSIVRVAPDGMASVGVPEEPDRQWSRVINPGEGAGFFNYDVSDDGSLMGITNNEGLLQVVDVATGDLVGDPIRDDGPSVFAFGFSPDATLLAVYFSFSNEIELYDPRTGQPTGPPISLGDLTGGPVFFSPDGRSLLISHLDGPISVADVPRRTLQTGQLIGHTSRIADAVFLGDGTTVATAGVDDTVRLWDFETRLPLGRPAPFTFGRANATDSQSSVLHVTEDGVLIPTPAGVLAADLRHETLIDRACARAGRNLSRSLYAQYLPTEEYRASCPQYPSG